ncbi:MAG: hypothetical protein A2X18_04880 [Bacteroidetes bacterium GWF2_40_14]|nr:MAG: hypothetical protein A2X18_04880 [Bacteroidetes bacterium GWF2_40_14]
MKKFLSTLIVGLFVFSTVSYAQNQQSAQNPIKKNPSFWYGPKVGVDLLTPTVDQDEITAQVKSNYQIGFFLQFGRTFYFQPEFYYRTHKENYGNANDEVTVNTLKVPMMFGVRLLNLKVVSAHLMAGPTASFLLKESVTDPDRKKSNFALQAGGGVDVLGFITLDVRYSVDINSTTNEQIRQLGWDSGVNVTLGIKLR